MIRSLRPVWSAVCLLLSTAAVSGRARAQLFTRPELHWQSVHTAHFDVHFPEAMRPWALHVAGRLEAARGAVVRLVGNTPSHRVTVVIDDPYNLTNGAALPVLNAPTIVLWDPLESTCRHASLSIL